MNPFIYLLNLFGKWWDVSDVTCNDDVQTIRKEAPFRGLILDASEPVVVAPGVYLFDAYEYKTGRMSQFRAYVLRGIVCFEKHR